MIILNALYKRPENEDEFQSYYKNTHMPLALKTPGLLKADAEMITSVFMGERDNYYMIARLYFETREDFDTAMSSPENQAAGRDLKNFAKAGVDLFVTEI